MKWPELLSLTCVILLLLSLLAALVGCSCIDKDYKTGACTVYQKDGDDLVFVSQEWYTRPCGCDDLYETFLRQAPLDTNYCVKCNHPYNTCNSFNTCP